jgi:hypothetical protein
LSLYTERLNSLLKNPPSAKEGRVPFYYYDLTDRHKEYLQIYVRNVGEGRYILTDDGAIVEVLNANGMSLSRNEMDKFLSQNKLQLDDDGDIFTFSALQELPSSAHSLFCAMAEAFAMTCNRPSLRKEELQGLYDDR